MTQERKMSLIGFLQAQNCSTYPGSWRHPGSDPGYLTPEYYQTIARTTTLHADFPGRMCKEGNMGIPFSPADVELGASYEFTVYHIVDAEDPYHLFPIEYSDVKGQP